LPVSKISEYEHERQRHYFQLIYLDLSRSQTEFHLGKQTDIQNQTLFLFYDILEIMYIFYKILLCYLPAAEQRGGVPTVKSRLKSVYYHMDMDDGWNWIETQTVKQNRYKVIQQATTTLRYSYIGTKKECSVFISSV